MIVFISPKFNFGIIGAYIAFFIALALLILTVIKGITADYGLWILIPLILLGVYIPYRYLRSMILKEEIIVSPEEMTIKKKFFFLTNKRKYEGKKIRLLELNDEGELAPHYLEDRNDSLGFGVEEKGIFYVNKRGRIKFRYNNKDVFFGRNIMEEEVSEIIDIIKKYIPQHPTRMINTKR